MKSFVPFSRKSTCVPAFDPNPVREVIDEDRLHESWTVGLCERRYTMYEFWGEHKLCNKLN